MPARLKPSFRAALTDNGVLEMCVYEEIGENFWTGGGVTAKSVKQCLDSAGPFNSILLRINSPGGDAFEGVAIKNLLLSKKKPINGAIDGIAASAASILAMCADTLTMGRSAMMMIHKAWTGQIGNADDMRKMADTLDTIDASLAESYAVKTGKSAEEILQMMAAETWMGADECVKEGFASAVDDSENERAMALASSFKALARLKHVPEQLRATRNDDLDEANPDDPDECQCPCDPCEAGECENCDHEDCDCANCEDCPMKADDGDGMDDAAKLDVQAEAPAVIAPEETAAAASNSVSSKRGSALLRR